MKKLLTLLLCFALSTPLFATIRRVGYNGIALTGVDYASINAAQTDSAPGDTIQIYGSESGTITKRLVIMGFGYNFEVHPNLQVLGTDAPSNANLTFGAGSDGSIATGLSGSFTIGTDNSPTVSDITFQRCYGSFTFYNNAVYSQISNVKILSSVITSGGMVWNSPDDFPVTNLQVYNCIIGGGFNLYKSGTTASFINCVSASPSIVGNFSLGLNDAGVLVKNCILGGANTSTNINTVYESNFFAETQPAVLPAGSNNRWGNDWTVLFNRLGATSDQPSHHGYAVFDEEYFVLKAGSPAVNGGFNGSNAATNCGIYGGEAAYVYKLSGVPAVPAIYKLTAPGNAATTNPYNVTISVRSNN